MAAGAIKEALTNLRRETCRFMDNLYQIPLACVNYYLYMANMSYSTCRLTPTWPISLPKKQLPLAGIPGKMDESSKHECPDIAAFRRTRLREDRTCHRLFTACDSSQKGPASADGRGARPRGPG